MYNDIFMCVVLFFCLMSIFPANYKFQWTLSSQPIIWHMVDNKYLQAQRSGSQGEKEIVLS